MSDDPVVQAPARLMDEPTAVGSLLTESEASFRSSLDEARAWKRVKPTLGMAPTKPRSRRRLFVFGVATSTTAMAIGWYAGVRYARTAGQLASASGGSVMGVQPPAWAALVGGETVLAEGLRLVVSAATDARYSRDLDGTRVQLVRGQIAFSVTQQPNSTHIFVDCSDHEFRVAAARFTLTGKPGCVKLEVSEGQVAVLKDGIPITLAKAGEHWTSEPCNAAAP